MKIFQLALCLALATTALAAEPRTDLTLLNGTVLKRARIISIKDDVAVVVHAGGTSDVPADQIEVVALVAAQKEIAERAAEEKRRTSTATAQQEKRDAEARTAAKAREEFTAGDLAAKKLASANNHPARVQTDSIQKLKADFPPKSTGTVRLGTTSQRSRTSTSRPREDSIQYTVPSDDVWSWYRGMFQTTTIQALPRTLEMVNKRINEDMEKLGHVGGGESARVQAQQTQQWLQRTLVPYATRWRALLPP